MDPEPAAVPRCPTGTDRVASHSTLEIDPGRGLATVAFALADGCRDVALSLASYRLSQVPPEAGGQGHEQLLYDADTGLFSAGEVHELTAAVDPDCYHHVTFIVGTPSVRYEPGSGLEEERARTIASRVEGGPRTCSAPLDATTTAPTTTAPAITSTPASPVTPGAPVTPTTTAPPASSDTLPDTAGVPGTPVQPDTPVLPVAPYELVSPEGPAGAPGADPATDPAGQPAGDPATGPATDPVEPPVELAAAAEPAADPAAPGAGPGADPGAAPPAATTSTTTGTTTVPTTVPTTTVPGDPADRRPLALVAGAQGGQIPADQLPLTGTGTWVLLLVGGLLALVGGVAALVIPPRMRAAARRRR